MDMVSMENTATMDTVGMENTATTDTVGMENIASTDMVMAKAAVDVTAKTTAAIKRLPRRIPNYPCATKKRRAPHRYPSLFV